MKVTRVNAAKGTRRRSFLSNAVCDVQLIWACRVCTEHLGQKASPTTIIRRAVEQYCGRLEVLLEDAPNGPAAAYEKTHLRTANKSQESAVTEREVSSGPLESLRNMEAAKRHGKPKMIDLIRKGLRRCAQAAEPINQIKD